MTLATTSAEIVNRQGAIEYLSSLRGNINQTVTGELETLLAGLRNAGLTDDTVIGPITRVGELLTSTANGIDAALASLRGGHASVSEAVNAVPAASKTDFYKDA